MRRRWKSTPICYTENQQDIMNTAPGENKELDTKFLRYFKLWEIVKYYLIFKAF